MPIPRVARQTWLRAIIDSLQRAKPTSELPVDVYHKESPRRVSLGFVRRVCAGIAAMPSCFGDPRIWIALDASRSA